jgi:thiamine pyrophosphokinase
MKSINSKFNLPQDLLQRPEWVLVGPMGPALPPELMLHAIMAVDGGSRFTATMDVWIGDGDSGVPKPVGPDVIKFNYPSEKDTSDLALALALFENENPYQLHLWGFIGGRQDHQLFNLGEALSFLRSKKHTCIYFYHGQTTPLFVLYSPGQWSIEHQGLFSLGSLETGDLELRGDCRYPIPGKQRLSPLSSRGLSNFASGTISFTNAMPIFIYYPEEA